jgi:hypothetical protein
MAGVTQKRSSLPGGGPWRILPECPSLLHNSTNSATSGPSEMRCVCPRALALKKVRNARRCAASDQTRAQRRAKGEPTRGYRPVAPKPTPGFALSEPFEPSDIRFGACANERGQAMMDRLLGAKGGERGPLTRLMKETMCSRCPARAMRACLQIGIDTRSPGVYGGLSESELGQLIAAREQVNAGA